MKLNKFINEITNNNWNVYGVEIYEDNHLILNYGITQEHRYPIYSATKTITSIAAGMAVDARKLDIERPVLYYVPTDVLSQISNEQQKLFDNVTIERLLTMSVSGFPFRPVGESWLKSVLSCSVNSDLHVFDYSNVSAYLVGVAVTNALQEDLYDFLKIHLFEPLNISKPPYQKCPDGYFYGATGMELSVNELSRIGILLMNNGRYNGEQLVSEKYVRDACRVHQMNREGGYGYFVWKYKDGFSINGKWGQKCYMFPEKHLMVTYLAHMEENSELITYCMKKHILEEDY